MTVMADYPPYQRPQRRPVGGPAGAAAKPAQHYPVTQQAQPPVSPTHYHSRTASSAIFSPAAPHPAGYSNVQTGLPPAQHQQQQQLQPQQQQQQQQYSQQAPQPYAAHPVRRMTNSTVSSTDSNPRTYPQQGYLGTQGQNQNLPYRNKSQSSGNSSGNGNGNGNLRRSTSSRSQASSLGPSSYVALLRKQKATVWCERTQHQDPRIAAQARVAKQRAAHEIMKQSQGRNSIAMSTNANAASTGGMLGGRKKYGGRAATGGGGTGANLAAGVNVPMRLSASEVGDEEGDDDDYGPGGVHRRTNSGKSSLTGGGLNAQNRLTAPRTGTRLSQGSSTGRPTSISPHTPPGEATPPTLVHRGSTGSGGSEERREREMGDVGDMLAPSAAETQEKKLSKDELSRRGSVDERTTTMRGAAGAMRLFVANPDASDSD